MNGMYQVGGLLGVFTVSFFADRWGRRVAIGVSAAIVLVSGALLAGSVNVGMVRAAIAIDQGDNPLTAVDSSLLFASSIAQERLRVCLSSPSG